MRHSKGRFFFMGVIIALLAYLVFFVSGLASGLSHDNASAIEQFHTYSFLVEKDADARINRSNLTTATVQKLRNALGKRHTAVLDIQSTTIHRKGKMEKIDMGWFHLSRGKRPGNTLVAGKRPASAATHDIIIDRSIMRSGVQIGDQIIDQATGLRYRVVGMTSNETYSHMPVAYLNNSQWHELAKKSGPSFINQGHQALLTNQSISRVRARMKQAGLADDSSVYSSTAIIKALPGYSAEQGSLTMMMSFLFIISVFILGIFFYIITAQKSASLGILKAIGTNSGYLVRSLINQSLIILLISLGISLVMTALTAALLPSGMPFALSFSLITELLVCFLGISLLSILLSIHQVIKADALSAIEGKM